MELHLLCLHLLYVPCDCINRLSIGKGRRQFLVMFDPRVDFDALITHSIFRFGANVLIAPTYTREAGNCSKLNTAASNLDGTKSGHYSFQNQPLVCTGDI
jgi:hypothetical protein